MRSGSRYAQALISIVGALGIGLATIPNLQAQTYTRVYGWGSNGAGQLGHNTAASYLVPVMAELYGKSPVAIAVGPGHTLALDADGTIYAWGSNFAGQLGNNSTTDSSLPVIVNTASGTSALFGKTVIAIAAGDSASYALTSDGKVYAWGLNSTFGQLGNNSTAVSLVPIAVDASGVLAGKSITKIAAGRQHVLVLASDGTVYSWGKNAHEGGSAAGQLGNNSSALYSRVPVAVVTSGVLAGKVITDIAAGGIHSVACASDGTAYAWGLNSSNGQLGNGTKVDSKVPVAVFMGGALAGKSVVAVAAGYVHCMALTSDGHAYAWGYGGGGRLGDLGGTERTTPVAVSTSGALSGKTVTAIAAGGYHSMCLTSDGAVYSWGSNFGPGSLGDNSTFDRWEPVPVNTTSGLSALAGATVLKLQSGSISTSAAVIATSTRLSSPDAPIDVSATATQGQAVVTFAAPPSTGGASITGYTLTVSPGGTTLAVTSSPVTVTGLTNGVAYTFTMTATNSLGTSSASVASAPVTPPIPYVFTTLAGSGTAGLTNNTGPLAQFNLPSGVAVSGSSIYLADSANHTIRKITTAGVVTTFAGSGSVGSANGTGAAASFNTPTGVAVDGDGNVYVADSGNHTIRKITSAGVVTTLAGSGSPGSSNGNGGSASFNTPLGVGVDSSGNVYVADSQNHRIRKITTTGDVTTYAGDGYPDWSDDWGDYTYFNTPSGIAVDTSDNVYVADSGNHAIRKIDPGQYVSTLAGYGWQSGSTDETGTNARFNNPTGVAIDTSGTVFVADRGNHKIRKITAAGVVTTLAGTGSSGWADGTGTFAVFNQPAGIAVTGSGTLYVADYANHLIRSGELDGVPMFTGANTASGQVGASLSYQIAFSHSPTGYNATGLPAGLSVDTATGIISGTPTTAGVVTITVGATNAYGAASSSLQLTISSGSQTITFGTLAAKIFGDAAFTISATVSSGLAPTFNVVSGPATISGATVTLTGAGAVVVRASQSGNSNYSAATPVEQSFNVAQGVATVTLGGLNQTYSGTARSATATTAPSGLTVNLTYDGGVTPPTTAGTYAVVGTVSDANYTGTASGALVIGKAAQTIVFDSLANKTYGDGAFAVSATASSGLTPTYSIVSGPAMISGHMLTVSGVGNVVVRASQAGNENFGAATPVERSFTITKATATLTLGGLNQTYDGSAKTVTATTLPLGLTAALTYDGSSAAPSAAGSYAVIATIADDNYAASATGTLTVGPATQTIVFTQPAAHVANEAPFSLSATTNSGLPVSFSVVSGPATISGATVTLTAVAGTVTIQASQSGDQNYAAAVSVNRSFTVTATPVETTSPVILIQPLDQTVTSGATATFSVTATANPNPTYQWRRNGAVLGSETSATLSLSDVKVADTGTTFDVVVSNSQGSVVSQSATLTVSPVDHSEQIFFGSLGTDGRFALYLRSDGEAVLIGELPAGQGSFMTKFLLDANGAFRSSVEAVNSLERINETSGTRTIRKAMVSSPVFSGSIVNGQLLGQVDGTGTLFNGVAKSTGTTAAFAGFYEAPAINGGSGMTYLIVGYDGEMMTAQVQDASIEIDQGAITAGGQFSVPWDVNATLAGSIDRNRGVTANLLTGGVVTASIAGASVDIPHTDRLVNISTRGISGDNDSIIIGGFVISSGQPRSVLIRAVGPGLTALGVTGVMENPVLTLFSGNEAIMSNDDWGSTDAAMVTSEAARLGAFALATGSKDAVLHATLAPGAYSAQVTRASGSANGVALIEVYDASDPGTVTPQLVNISARGNVRTGDGILISGFVITGNYPRKVLVRGVGPSLARQGVAGMLVNPVLRLYRSATIIATNDDWTTDNAVAIKGAAAQVGAFPLDDSSHDAALLVTLAPGIYTAQVSGADSSTGIALVEVYAVP